MDKEEILQTFHNINHAYNDCSKYDTLERMLDEFEETLNQNKYAEGVASGYRMALQDLGIIKKGSDEE